MFSTDETWNSDCQTAEFWCLWNFGSTVELASNPILALLVTTDDLLLAFVAQALVQPGAAMSSRCGMSPPEPLVVQNKMHECWIFFGAVLFIFKKLLFMKNIYIYTYNCT